MRKPYLDKCSNTLNRYIKKYGKNFGSKKFYDRQEKRKKTMLEKYGKIVLTSYVSKESLKILIKLYKKVRLCGIKKNDIIWGIAKNKEFNLTDYYLKKTFFYDFVIKSKRIIIEYNNLFWHPREGVEWRGLYDYNDALNYQKIKKNTAINNGYKLYYIWNDDNIGLKLDELVRIICNG